jgi:hypothetical protein
MIPIIKFMKAVFPPVVIFEEEGQFYDSRKVSFGWIKKKFYRNTILRIQIRIWKAFNKYL